MEPCKCGGEMWERPTTNGGGFACVNCHPDPRTLIAEWVEAGRPSYNAWLARGRPNKAPRLLVLRRAA
jgi:hypothetical protein